MTGKRRDDRSWWPRAKAFLRTLLSEADDDRLLGLAAESAFFVVLSIFPGLLIMASLLGLLEGLLGADLASRVEQTVTGALDRVLTDQASGAITSVTDLFGHARGKLLTFASLGALVSLSGAFAAIIGALNLAYETPDQRSWLHRRLVGAAFALVSVVLVGLLLTMLVLGPFLGAGDDIAERLGFGPAFASAWQLLRYPFVLVAVTLWAAALFHFGPHRRTPWRSSWPGAILTAVLWLAATVGFHLYLRIAGQANPVLGAFGGGVIVMMWVYLLSLALLLGAEVNAVILDRRTRRTDRRVRGR